MVDKNILYIYIGKNTSFSSSVKNKAEYLYTIVVAGYIGYTVYRKNHWF